MRNETDHGFPASVAWHQSRAPGEMPHYEGANPDAWREKYGAGSGGWLEVSMGDDYPCIMMDARGYETVGALPLRNLKDSEGNRSLCCTPLTGSPCS